MPASCAAGQAFGDLSRDVEELLDRQRAAGERVPAASPRPRAPSRCRRRRSDPMSWIVTMLGWFSAEADRASFSNRLRRSGSEPRSRQHLDRDFAPQPRVPRPVDLPHPARAQRRDDLVGPEAGPGGKAQLLDSFYDEQVRRQHAAVAVGVGEPVARYAEGTAYAVYSGGVRGHQLLLPGFPAAGRQLQPIELRGDSLTPCSTTKRPIGRRRSTDPDCRSTQEEPRVPSSSPPTRRGQASGADRSRGKRIARHRGMQASSGRLGATWFPHSPDRLSRLTAFRAHEKQLGGSLVLAPAEYEESLSARKE